MYCIVRRTNSILCNHLEMIAIPDVNFICLISKNLYLSAPRLTVEVWGQIRTYARI